MSEFRALNDDFAAIVRGSFNRQGLMHLLGATLEDVQPGYVNILLPFTDVLI